MSSKRSAARKLQATTHASDHQEVCDQLFSWSDVDNRTDTMSLPEAASLLGIELTDAETMIAEDNLCATKDETTKEWLVKIACVRAQLAGEDEDTAGTELHADATDTATASGDRPAEVPFSDASAHHHATRDGETSAPAEGFSRQSVTRKNIEALMDSLDFANVRLEGSMYRIGYLEAQVASLQEQLKVLPEFRSKAAQAILIDRENDILEEEIAEQRARNDLLLEGNVRLATELQNAHDELDKLHASVDALERAWWWAFVSWFFGFCFRPEERREPA